MAEQSYFLHCKIEVASANIAREFDLGRYQYQYKVVAAREREDSGRVIWRLRHTDPDFSLGSLECVPGPKDTTRLIVEDPPITAWKPTALEEVDGDCDRLAEMTESKIKGAKARDTAHRSIQVMLVEDLLHTLEAEYDIPVSSPAAEAARRALADWGAGKAVSLPWQSPFPFALEDVEAACHEHLERLAGKRFPADWDVQVRLYKEREGIAIRYDIQSMNRIVGHLRVRRIDAQQTQLEVTANPYGNEAGEARLREIMAAFAGRWLAELPASSHPSTRAGQGDLTMVNLSSTAGTMSPGLYPAKPGQAKAIELANAAISNLEDEFGVESVGFAAAAVAEDEESLDELRKSLLSKGHHADQIERAIEEYRREQQTGEQARKDVKPGETQNLTGIFIEPMATLHGGVITGEPDGVVSDRRFSRIETRLEHLIKMMESLSAGERQAGGGYRSTGPSSTARQQGPRKVGRPRNVDDDWAYNQVRLFGRSRKEVFPEWRQRIRERANILADPLDSFNKIFSSRDRNKREKTD